MGEQGLLRRLVIFVLLGGALLALDVAVWRPLRGESAPEAIAEPIVVSAEEVAKMREEWRKSAGAEPNDKELAALLGQRIDEELLFREGLGVGFDQTDPVVYQLLVQNMRFLEGEQPRDDETLYREALKLGMANTDPLTRRYIAKRVELLIRRSVWQHEIADAELSAYLGENADDFRVPTRVGFHHVFFSEQRHQEPEAEAKKLLPTLPSEPHERTSTRTLGDPTALPRELAVSTETEIAKRFGPAFAAAVSALPEGGWHGPLSSPYGVHLVWIDSRIETRVPPLEEIRERVRYALLRKREKSHLRERLEALRSKYEIRIEGEGIPAIRGVGS